MTYVITDACVDVMDRSCIRECPVDCIYEGNRQVYVHPDECIDCGACEAVCPQDAIFYEADMPDELTVMVERQASMFVSLGRLGGARKFGPLGKDHPDVEALPPRTPNA